LFSGAHHQFYIWETGFEPGGVWALLGISLYAVHTEIPEAGSGADPALVEVDEYEEKTDFKRTVVSFYSQMRTHRRVLTAARGKIDRNFDLQLTSFSTCTSKHFRSLDEYLQPIQLSSTFISSTQAQDVIRNEYSLYLQTRTLKYAVR